MNWEGIITLGVLAGVGFIIYTRMKKQDLKDTYGEIKDLFVKKEE